MSKTNSGLFTSTIGANASIGRFSHPVRLSNPRKGTSRIDPNEIRYSQTSVNGSEKIIESMKKNGWLGDPIDVVTMTDGKLTTLDNTRVVAARAAGIKAEARVHGYDEPLPDRATAERFATPKGGVPSTWGQAIENRIGKQSSSFRRNSPNGSYNMNKIK